MQTLNDAEIWRVINARMGYRTSFGFATPQGQKQPDSININSLDALRPVLGKLTDNERHEFLERVRKLDTSHMNLSYFYWHAFTLEPTTLARLIAEAIVACRAKEAA